MILNLEEIGTVKQEGGLLAQQVPSIPVDASSLSAVAQKSNSSNVKLMRVLHTRQEITMYPNGESFLGKTQVWFEDHIYPIKKKPRLSKYKTETEMVEL